LCPLIATKAMAFGLLRPRVIKNAVFGFPRLLARVPRWIVATILISALASAALGVEPAPELKLQTLNGNPFSLRSLKGYVVVLDFWASWCVPCRTSFPFLGALQGKYQSQGLRVGERPDRCLRIPHAALR
jgi:thiol:disulfide interchange protein